MKASGKVEVATQEPAKTGDPITLTATSEGQAGSAGRVRGESEHETRRADDDLSPA